MADFLEILQNRRSVRTYTGEPVSEEDIKKILEAGMLSASSRGFRPWEFIVVKDKDTLKEMSQCRSAGAGMLTGADCAIVVIGDSNKTDVLIEDCSIVMSNMHLMADSLGLGSCWIQGRLRERADGQTAEDYLRNLLGYPENYKLEAMLSLGTPASKGAAYSLDSLDWGKVHEEKF